MNNIFQFSIQQPTIPKAPGFAAFGLKENPFPASGLGSGVLYSDHLASELEKVNRWLQATAPIHNGTAPFRPLAMFGTLGVGKTHILNHLESGIRSNLMTPILRKNLTEEGTGRLLLSDLLLRYLPSGNGADGSRGLIRRLIEAGKTGDIREKMKDSLRQGSPLIAPFDEVWKSDDQELSTLLERWIRREHTTPGQRGRLSLSGVLPSEGAAIRVVADLMRMARAAGLINVWFILIDQLEELWRPDVITPSRRARFLTDLRQLIDEGLESAPIALLLAWNTTVDPEMLFSTNGVGQRLSDDYLALSQRLDNRVELPLLRLSDIWPFAKKYLDAAGVEENGRGKELFAALKKAAEEIASQNQGPTALAPRKVLAAWRTKAQEIVEGSKS